MIWVTWRHHRTSLIVSLGFIAALAMAAIVGGIGTRSSLVQRAEERTSGVSGSDGTAGRIPPLPA